MSEACPRSVAAAAPALVSLVGHASLAERALVCLVPTVPELATRDPDALEDLRGRLAPVVEARCGGGRAAKAAVRLAAVAGADEASDLLGDAFRKLAGALPRLAGPDLRAALRVLAAFAFHLPLLFDAEKKKLTSLLVSGIIFSGSSTKSPAKEGGKKERRQAAAGEPSEDACIRAAAAKVLVKFLLGLGKADAQAAGGAVVKVLQRLMAQRPAAADDSSQAAVDAEYLRQVAALSLARATAGQHLSRLLTPELSLAACWPMLGETPALRRRFVTKLERLGREGMAPRFLVALALGAEDSAKPIAAAACAALRSTMADWKRRTANTPAKVLEDLVPFLVFVVAHRPNFTHDQPGYKGAARCLQAYLQPLIELGRGDNFPYVQQLLCSVKQTDDALDPRSTALLEVAELALLVALDAARTKPAAAGPSALVPQVLLWPDFFLSLDRAAAAQRLSTQFVPTDILKPGAGRKAAALTDDTPNRPSRKGKQGPLRASQQSASLSARPKPAVRRRRRSSTDEGSEVEGEDTSGGEEGQGQGRANARPAERPRRGAKEAAQRQMRRQAAEQRDGSSAVEEEEQEGERAPKKPSAEAKRQPAENGKRKREPAPTPKSAKAAEAQGSDGEIGGSDAKSSSPPLAKKAPAAKKAAKKAASVEASSSSSASSGGEEEGGEGECSEGGPEPLAAAKAVARRWPRGKAVPAGRKPQGKAKGKAPERPEPPAKPATKLSAKVGAGKSTG
eukprot:tig00020629_g12393.t1